MLQNHDTCDLVPHPDGSNVVVSKWVYRTKFNSYGTVQHLKARLVAQGFSQIMELDYTHTFNPVVKVATVRIVLSLVFVHKWNLHQLDVNTVFLNGQLTNIVFMEQPPCFTDPIFPNYVFRLKKALYGLKPSRCA